MVNLADEVIFISYNRKDGSIAQKVGDWINANDGFTSRIVGFSDSDLDDGIKLTDMLLSEIASCKQIMAVVSRNTVRSWWVPWEIGVGSEKRFKMSSYVIDEDFSESLVRSLPEYITMNPILGTKDDVDEYCSAQNLRLLESFSGQRPLGSASEEIALFRTTIKEKLKSKRGF